MFTRLLTVFLAVILCCVALLFSLSFLNLKDHLIESRMDALKNQARDMAYLASRLSADMLERSMGKQSATEQYMYWKAKRVYQEYNAYIIVVERNGQQRTYYSETTLQDESLRSLPGKQELSAYMEQVLQGKEIIRQTDSATGPLFTVIVPWIQENSLTGYKAVMGYVMIQTAAQTVHASYRALAWQAALSAAGLFLIAALFVFLFARQMTRPLTAMADAAGLMAKGDFNARAPEAGTREIRELAYAFNQMAAQLSTLEQSRRDFVANVSHELRSPITSIQGFAQGLLDGTIPPDESEHYLHIVVDETHRLSKLIANLLNLSRLESEETSLAYSDFDVNEMARRVLISRMSPLEEKEIEVDVDFETDACFVHADSDQIQQVLINLIDNAQKFTPARGKISIITRTLGDIVTLRVKDNGVGILPENQLHIFDRFYKADKAHTVGMGTGLGLSICRKIMEKHNQTISLISGEGGAEFEITLAKGKAPALAHLDAGTGESELDA